MVAQWIKRLIANWWVGSQQQPLVLSLWLHSLNHWNLILEMEVLGPYLRLAYLKQQKLIRLLSYFSFSRSALWVGTTSFMILVLPVVFETERLQLEQQQLQQQRQVSAHDWDSTLIRFWEQPRKPKKKYVPLRQYTDKQPEWSSLSLLDPVGAQHWDVRRDARHDAACTWQDVRDGKVQHEPEICCQRYSGRPVARRDRETVEKGKELQLPKKINKKEANALSTARH